MFTCGGSLEEQKHNTSLSVLAKTMSFCSFWELFSGIKRNQFSSEFTWPERNELLLGSRFFAMVTDEKSISCVDPKEDSFCFAEV